MESKSIVKALSALAQESRLGIYRLLVEQVPQGLTPGRIGESLDIAPATLSFHLKELVNADLISARQEGRFIIYATNFATMNGLVDFLTQTVAAQAVTIVPFNAPQSANPHGGRRRQFNRGESDEAISCTRCGG
jgi:ArsR family transcriptional regulator